MYTFYVNNIKEEKETINFLVNEEVSIEEWQTLESLGRILVDSQGKAFVYLLENDDGFHHVRISQDHWSELAESLLSNKRPVMVMNGQPSSDKELIRLWEEMKLLLENIKGNGNYGSNLVQEVEEVFKSFLNK
jgi:hypothetical protein